MIDTIPVHANPRLCEKLRTVRISPVNFSIHQTLKAFAVDNGRTTLIIFLLGDPHLLESGQGSQDGSTDPHRVFALRGRNDLDFHR